MEPISITITGVSLADLTGKIVLLAREMYAQQTPAQPVQQPVQTQAVAPAAPAAPVQQPAAPSAPTQAPQFTLAQIQTATAPLMDAGKQAELAALLTQFSITALTQLPEARYGEFATALRQLGAKL